MCGICGVFSGNRNSDLEKMKAATAAMNKSQEKRGPDDQGDFSESFSGGSVVFGHRRLSIIDLSADGHQPMRWEKQKSVGFLEITFNGEIYNFADLRADLIKKGFRFQTQTDTEVILALFEAEGEKSFARLGGMFAFALWDDSAGILYLVRDHFGIKPLYWAAADDLLVFASTVKAIEKSGLVNLTKNKDAWLAFLLFGSVPLPLTTWREITAVPAGCFLKIKGDRKETIRFYSSLPFFSGKGENSADYVSRTGGILRDSVKRHLASDAPLGVFLSGGLDSSAIAALAAEARNSPLTTLSVIFDEKDFSEERYQLMAAKKIGSDHQSLKLTQEMFLANLPGAWAAMDQPTIDGLNTYFIAQAAKEAGLKVVLSGLGSDELFLGYPNFHRARGLDFLRRLPMSGLLSSLGGKYEKIDFLRAGGVLGFYLSLRGIFSPKRAAGIFGVSREEIFRLIADLEEKIFGGDLENIRSLNPIQRLSYLETVLYMQNQLLKDSDFMGMAHSIEIRVPFVDRLVMEHVAGISPALKLRGSFNKQILIDAVKNEIPPAVYQRPKMGFAFPFEKWLKEEKSINGHWSQSWALKVLENFKT